MTHNLTREQQLDEIAYIVAQECERSGADPVDAVRRSYAVAGQVVCLNACDMGRVAAGAEEMRRDMARDIARRASGTGAGLDSGGFGW